MSNVPLLAKLVVAAVLAASIAGAFFGPPPGRPRPLAFRALAALGIALYAAAALAAWGAGSERGAALLVVAAVEAVCLAAWLARARGDDRRWPPEEDVGPDDDGPPFADWETFRRRIDRWERSRRRPREPAAR